MGRADRMGLAISLVSVDVEEKVWYCPKGRHPPCEDTSLYSQGGNCKWYNETKLLHLIEARLRHPIEAMTSDFQLPPSLAALGAVYGQERGETEETSAYIQQLRPVVQDLANMETAAQHNWWEMKTLLAQAAHAVGKQGGDGVPRTVAGPSVASGAVQKRTHESSGAVATGISTNPCHTFTQPADVTTTSVSNIQTQQPGSAPRQGNEPDSSSKKDPKTIPLNMPNASATHASSSDNTASLPSNTKTTVDDGIRGGGGRNRNRKSNRNGGRGAKGKGRGRGGQ